MLTSSAYNSSPRFAHFSITPTKLYTNMKIQFLLAIFLLFASKHGVGVDAKDLSYLKQVTSYFMGSPILETGIQPNSIRMTIKNHCPYSISPATLTSRGASASTTGFELASQASRDIEVPPSWEGRIWARFQCAYDWGRYYCRSADCDSGREECNGNGGKKPATLAEFKLNGDGGKDSYDVSLVDGFNLPVSIVPQAGCPVADCPVDINAKCWSNLAVKDLWGWTIGCKSACLVYGSPEFCCTGSHNQPQTCPPTDYSMFFKNLCPRSYSYAFDDPSSTFTCNAGSNYLITFCP